MLLLQPAYNTTLASHAVWVDREKTLAAERDNKCLSEPQNVIFRRLVAICIQMHLPIGSQVTTRNYISLSSSDTRG